MENFTQMFLLSMLFALYGCSPNTDKTDNNHQTEKKSEYLLPGLDHGLMQSPINILSKGAEQGTHNVTLNFSGEINRVENLGHTVQLDFEPGNTVTYNDMVYEFKQLHFHTPSEHRIDGMTFPMEMHVVNVLQGQKKEDVPKYLVIAYLLKMGDENQFISNFIDLIPENENESIDVAINILTGDITEDDIMMEWKHFYHYKGSLTTSPYTESVDWYVLSNIFEASPEQILRINELEGDNARRIQAIHDRELDKN